MFQLFSIFSSLSLRWPSLLVTLLLFPPFLAWLFGSSVIYFITITIIFRFYLFDRVKTWRLLSEIESRPIVCTIRQRQLRLYGHVARFQEIDPACLSDCLRKRHPGVEAKGTSAEFVAWEVDESYWDVYLEWEGGLHADLPGGTTGNGDVGYERRRAIRRVLPMTDWFIYLFFTCFDRRCLLPIYFIKAFDSVWYDIKVLWNLLSLL